MLDCLGRCLKLYVSTDSTSSHEFACQFGLAIFYTRKTHKTYREHRVPRKCLLNAPVTVDRSIASDNMSGNNSDHSGERLSQNGERLSQNGDNESLYLHELEKSGLGLLFRSLCVCTVCVKINNDELFFNAFPFKNSFEFISG